MEGNNYLKRSLDQFWHLKQLKNTAIRSDKTYLVLNIKFRLQFMFHQTWS